MGKFSIWILTLAIYAPVVVLPMVIPATAETSSSKHIKKHKKIILRSPGFDQAWPVASPSSQATPVCPGMARSFQCKIWPPPMEDDPDRKIPDGGGM